MSGGSQRSLSPHRPGYDSFTNTSVVPSGNSREDTERLDAPLGGAGLVENGVFKRPGIVVLGYEW